MDDKQQSRKQNQYHPDFDELLTLAQGDPELFEVKRREYIEHFFTRVPTEKQRRLRGLQWQIDQTRNLARTPMASCMNIMNMMWDSLNHLRDQQQALVKFTSTELSTSTSQKSATRTKLTADNAAKGKIIPFPKR